MKRLMFFSCLVGDAPFSEVHEVEAVACDEITLLHRWCVIFKKMSSDSGPPAKSSPCRRTSEETPCRDTVCGSKTIHV